MPLWLADLIHRVCKQICAIILTLPTRLSVHINARLSCIILSKGGESIADSAEHGNCHTSSEGS